MFHDVTTLRPAPGITLHAERWKPDGEPRGTVVIAHGIAEHITRYRYVAERLVDAGWIVAGPDHRGHGRSSGRQGDLRDLGAAAADLDAVIEWAGGPPTPVVLLGHSMGSLIACIAALRSPERFTALVLSGTALDAGSGVPAVAVAALKGLARIRPSARLTPPLELDAICSDPAVRRAYDEDPLVDRGRPRLGTALATLNAAETIRARAGTITVPTLLVHGAGDTLTPPSGATWLAAHLGGGARLVEFPGRHEVLNEPNRDEVIDTIIEWLATRT